MKIRPRHGGGLVATTSADLTRSMPRDRHEGFTFTWADEHMSMFESQFKEFSPEANDIFQDQLWRIRFLVGKDIFQQSYCLVCAQSRDGGGSSKDATLSG